MAINARIKGASGEREFCKFLFENFDFNELPQRNLEQVRSGGADIVGIKEFPNVIFEVKRVEILSLLKWHHQVKAACNENEMGVVAFRQNRKGWEFLMPSTIVGVKRGYVRMTEQVWVKWMVLNCFKYP